jgi:hypothetical protein
MSDHASSSATGSASSRRRKSSEDLNLLQSGDPQVPKFALLRLLTFFLVLGCITGCATGVTYMFQAARTRGVFGDLCDRSADDTTVDQSDGSCHAQRSALNTVADLSLSFLNSVSVIDGIAVDVLGGRRAVHVFLVLFGIGACCSGIAPGFGYIWAVCVCLMAWGSEGAFLSYVTFHVRALAPEEGSYAFWCSVFAGLWDLGVVVSIPVSRLLEDESVPLWLGYVMIGVIVAGSGLAYTLTFPATEPAVGGQHPQSSNSDCKTIVSHTWHTTKVATRRRLFWTCTAMGTFICLFGYFYFSTVETLMKWHGASDEQIAKGKRLFTVFRAASGACYLLPGYLVNRVGFRRGLPTVLVFQCLFFVTACALAGARGASYSEAKIYVSFVCLMAYRACAWTTTNIAILSLFRFYVQDSVSIVFGVCYTISGALSMAVGGAFTRTADDDPNRFPVILLSIAAVGAAAHAVATVVVRQEASLQEIARGCASQGTATEAPPVTNIGVDSTAGHASHSDAVIHVTRPSQSSDC